MIRTTSVKAAGLMLTAVLGCTLGTATPALAEGEEIPGVVAGQTSVVGESTADQGIPDGVSDTASDTTAGSAATDGAGAVDDAPVVDDVPAEVAASVRAAAPVGTYDAQAAIAYGAAHWNDGQGLCAEFVSNCLKAGGIGAWSRMVSGLADQLQVYGPRSLLVKNGNYVYLSDNLDRVGPGDVLLYRCRGCGQWLHSSLVSGIDGQGRLMEYAHNNARNAVVWAGKGFYPAHEGTGHGIDIYAVHLTRDADSTAAPMYRLYNPNSGEHFYTASLQERGNLIGEGWRDEGVGWTAPKTSSTPVYRLYNPNAGDHHYTTSATERDNLRAAGWNYEGIGWYSDDDQTVPLYRLYNPNAQAGSHHYTRDAAERDDLVASGWKDEGLAWHGLK